MTRWLLLFLLNTRYVYDLVGSALFDMLTILSRLNWSIPRVPWSLPICGLSDSQTLWSPSRKDLIRDGSTIFF